MIGNGLVTYDVFVTYALDKNLFLESLKMPRWIDREGEKFRLEKLLIQDKFKLVMDSLRSLPCCEQLDLCEFIQNDLQRVWELGNYKHLMTNLDISVEINHFVSKIFSVVSNVC